MQNPYRPPQSAVADADAIRRGPRPAAVSKACNLMWLALAASLLSLIPGIRKGAWEDPEVPILFTFIAVALVGLIVAWLIVRVYEGRNWARWTLVCFQALTWLLLMLDPAPLLEQGAIATSIDVAIVLIEIYACALLMWGEGAEWFKPPIGQARA